MSARRLLRLLAVEIRLILRERTTWAIIAALMVALWFGAYTGVARVASERAAITKAAEDAARAVREAKAAHERYGRPGPLKVSYWQDPTHAFGYLTQFLTVYAVKPPTPLAALAAGQSDVQPALMRVGFGPSTVFDDTAYELGSAAKIKLGPFDLAFVLVYLVPLAVIALVGTRLSAERDAGILRMIAAQPVSPRVVAGAKFGAATAVCVVSVLGGTALSLWLNGGLEPLGGWEATLALLAVALACYTVLWVLACALIASLWRGAVTALTLLVLAWACATIALPTALGLTVDGLAPTPSRIAAIDASRVAQDRFYNGDEGPRIMESWLATRAPEAAGRVDLRDAPEIKRLARDAFYDVALAEHRDAMQAHALDADVWSWRLTLLSPATTLARALETAAGTDGGRHATFLAAVAEYRQSLRGFFEPLILAQALKPAPICPGCQARLDFDAYDAVPSFPGVVAADKAERQALVSLICLMVSATVLSALVYRRYADWPA